MINSAAKLTNWIKLNPDYNKNNERCVIEFDLSSFSLLPQAFVEEQDDCYYLRDMENNIIFFGLDYAQKIIKDLGEETLKEFCIYVKVDAYKPNFTIHPGETVKSLMKINNYSILQLAKLTEIDEIIIDKIINGKHDVNSHIAVKFSKVFGLNSLFFIRLQGLFNGAKQ